MIEAAGGFARATASLESGEEFWLRLSWGVDGATEVVPADSQAALMDTAGYWNEWAGKLTYTGLYRAEVERSALALKLMFYEPTGAVVAAMTTSLPEEIGGVRNWDYRYCWLRDAAFTLSAFNIVGLHDEAERFVRYLQWVASKSEELQIMYGVGGEQDLTEQELPHLSGYRDSQPVRTGNGAHSSYSSTSTANCSLPFISGTSATSSTRSSGGCSSGWWTEWRTTGNGRTRVSGRSAASRVTTSTAKSCAGWRSIARFRMAEQLGAPPTLARWVSERDAIHKEVLERGWNEERQTFVQSYGSTTLDAANLLIPFYGFLPGSDPRMKTTIRKSLRQLTRDGMLYRYTSDDGISGREGAFSICTFWLADALILAGDREGGDRVFRRMLRFANHVGLYSEQLEPATGDFLGNFPQAFTHIALINTAHLLQR